MSSVASAAQTFVEQIASRKADENIEICVARSLEEVDELRECWNAWGGHRDSDIDFFLMIVESYAEALRPHVIVIKRNGAPDAILIGRLERKRITFNVGYLNVFRPWANCLTFVYGAIRGNESAENAQIFIREILNCLERGEANIALLEFVPTESPLYQLGLKLPGIFSRDANPPLQKHDMMQVPQSIEDVYRRMSGSRGKHIRSSARKLQAHADGALKIVCYRNPSDLDRLFRDAEAIAKQTYQRGLRAGFSDTDDIRKRLDLAAKKGWLRANLLYIGDRPVAFWIGMLYGERFVSEYMGYDPEFRQFSPGMVLIMRVIEGFCVRVDGDIVTELDFGLGHAEYKAALCTKTWDEAPIYIFGPGLTGLYLKSLRTATSMADKAARKTLESTQLLPRLKKIWRTRLSSGARHDGGRERNIPEQSDRRP